MKNKVVKVARTDLGWMKEAMASIRMKAGTESSRLKVNSIDGSRNTSNLSLRGGAGDISSLKSGGNGIFGFGRGSDTCVSI